MNLRYLSSMLVYCLVGCASTPTEEIKVGGRIGIINTVDDTVGSAVLGLTVFGNEFTEEAVDWRVRDLITDEVVARLNERPEVKDTSIINEPEIVLLMDRYPIDDYWGGSGLKVETKEGLSLIGAKYDVDQVFLIIEGGYSIGSEFVYEGFGTLKARGGSKVYATVSIYVLDVKSNRAILDRINIKNNNYREAEVSSQAASSSDEVKEKVIELEREIVNDLMRLLQ